MPNVNNPALATASAAQTQAAGSRMLGYYLGAGGVKVDCLFDTANFMVKDGAGTYRAAPAANKDVRILAAAHDTISAPTGGLTFTRTDGGQLQAIFGAENGGLVMAAREGLIFSTGGGALYSSTIERARIDASGNFGIGLAPSHRLHVRSTLEIARFETTTARGSGAAFIGIADPSGRKGYWGYGGANDSMFLINEMNNVLVFGTNGISRWGISATGNIYPITDNSYSLGAASNRATIIYAATGTINTSDEREKTWRGAPNAAELSAARRIAAQLGFYQWNDAITEKGEDGARLHFGVRAQAVWAIMADEGLIDPIVEGEAPSSRYAFLCHDAWDAVEAVPEQRDEEDNIIVNAVPAREAGDRFGIRPDQLALFLIAAQEARLAALEAA